MSEHESGEERIDDSGRNATQQRMDDEGVEDVPVADEPNEERPADRLDDDPDKPWAS